MSGLCIGVVEMGDEKVVVESAGLLQRLLDRRQDKTDTRVFVMGKREEAGWREGDSQRLFDAPRRPCPAPPCLPRPAQCLHTPPAGQVACAFSVHCGRARWLWCVWGGAQGDGLAVAHRVVRRGWSVRLPVWRRSCWLSLWPARHDMQTDASTRKSFLLSQSLLVLTPPLPFDHTPTGLCFPGDNDVRTTLSLCPSAR